MPEDTDIPEQLEEQIPELLDRAISIIQKKGRAINLHRGKEQSYIAFSGGIKRYWKSYLPNGNPITDWEDGIPSEEFLDWLTTQSHDVQQQVYQNLKDYINTSPEPNKRESIHPGYLFGY